MSQLLVTLQNLPPQSGVYQYFDSQGKLLYVGKAKNLKNRVRSYFRTKPMLSPAPNLSPRITKMVSETVQLQYILVDSEHDALILENSLIKQLRPKYNILLRDDKTFPYIYLDHAKPFPRPEITRKILKGRKIEYFGPFSLGARDMLDTLYELLPLVQKQSCLRGKKLCLFYQIGRCLGPCEGKVTAESYQEIVGQARDLINNKSSLLKQLQQKMDSLAEQLRFEEAAKMRDRIEKIGKMEQVSQMDFAKLENLDVIAIETAGRRAALVRLFMRQGKVVSSAHHLFGITERFDLGEAYKRAILNHYDQKPPLPPKQVLLPELCEDIEAVGAHLDGVMERSVEIIVPQRGEKKRLVSMALTNARELLKIESSQQTGQTIEEKIQELLGLEEMPERFETFDTSHHQGTAPVGSVVTYQKEFVKEGYRHYHLEARDEYGQMRELLQRRIESFEQNGIPDLWVLDGGKAQLNLAQDLIASTGVNLDVIAISKEKIDAKAHRAKGSARDLLHSPVFGVLELQPTDARLQFFQKLRDEAHRFAITFHRQQKAKRQKQFEMITVPGIGEAKITKLLRYFGSFEQMRCASLQELEAVLNAKDADSLRRFFAQLPPS